MKRLFAITLTALTLALCSEARAQQLDNPVTIPVTIYGEGIIAGGTVAEFHFGQSLPGQPDVTTTASAPGGTHFYSGVYTANLVPGVDYNVTMTSTGCAAVFAHFRAQNAVVYLGPPGTSLAQVDSICLGANYPFVLRVELINDITSRLAGQRGGACSSFPEDKPIWYVGLGSLRNGRFAGAVGFRAPTIDANLFTTTALVYDPIDSSEVSVTRDGSGHITQVQSGGVVLKVTTINSTKYKIDCSLPETPTTVFITYTVSQYTGPGGGIRIDKLEGGVNWSTVLQSTSTTWTLYDWRVATASSNVDTSNPIITTVSGSNSDVAYGTGTGTNIRKKRKTFVGGELSTVVGGPGEPSAPTKSYAYYPDSTSTGWTSRLKWDIEPTGKWAKYDYFNDTAQDWAGQVKKVYRPWLTGPADPSSAADATCMVEIYDYVSNADETDTFPSSRVTKIQNVTAGQTTWDYDWNFVSVNGHTLHRITQKDYSGASAFLTTTTLAYKESDSSFFRGRPHSIVRPDGTKDAYAYFNGTWDAPNNAFNVYAQGGARQILVFHGNSTASTGSATLSSWNGWTLDTVYMKPNLSTVSEIIVDVHGRVVRTTEYVFVSSTSIEPISQTTHLFNGNGLPQKDKDYVRSISGVEVATTYGYSAGLLSSKVDIDGTRTEWDFDAWLRNTKIRTAASSSDSNYPTKEQTFDYYSSGLTFHAQECSCSPVSTTYIYDTAGRPVTIKEPKPSTSGNVSGTLDTSYVYDTPRKTTVTIPTGATKITEELLDGRPLSETGTSQVPAYYAYTLESGTARIVKTTKHESGTAVHGWLEETADWLGRTVTQRSPQVGWTSGNLAVKKNFTYDLTTGQLTSYATLDDSNQTALLPAHRYSYGDLGLLASEGDDVDGGGLANTTTSHDRITFYTYAYSKPASSWLFTKTSEVLRTIGSTTDKATTSVQTKLTGFSNTGLPTGSAVTSESTTTDASGRKTVALDYVTPSTRTRGRSTTLDGATQKGLTLWQDGYMKSDKSVSGVIKTYSYQDDGLLAAVTTGTGTTGASTSYLYYTGTKYVWKALQSTDASGGLATTEYTYTWDATAKTNTVKTTFAGSDSYTEYNSIGLPIRAWGAGAQPVRYSYDSFGRKTDQTTWQSGAFTGTTWPNPTGGNSITLTIDDATGAVTRKIYPNTTHVDFTYNARGQLRTRSWARSPAVTTTYKYYGDTGVSGDSTGELQMIDYPTGTTDVIYTYTRFGALATVADAAGTRTFAYNSDLTPSTETLGSFYGSKVLANTYQTFGRPSGWQFKNGSTVLAAATMGYDAATSRPSSISGALGTAQAIAFNFAYDSDGRADWVKTITSSTSGTSFKRETPLRSDYDVLSSVKTTWNTTTVLGDVTATYAPATGRRGTQAFGTSSYASQLGLGAKTSTFTHDSYGRLTDSVSTHTGSTVHWTYDLAGNRTTESDDTGLPSTSYSPTSLDTYSSITGGRAEAGIAFDLDGNLQQDGTWTYTYDAENRLTSMSRTSPTAQTLSFSYDYLGRRIRKTVAGTNASDTKYLWSGWNLVAEVSAADGYTVQKTFVWGPDFSNGQGTGGGAGSLLAQLDPTLGVSYAITDTFGTAVGYFTGSGTTATLRTAVEYTAYGEITASYAASGVALPQYPIAYHGHPLEWETGLIYFGRRYYWPKHGRFINRDPIEEAGGNNLYAFVHNSPVNGWDVLGLGSDDPIVLDPFEVIASRLPSFENAWENIQLRHELSQLVQLVGIFWFRFAQSSWVTNGTLTPPVLPKAPKKEQKKTRCQELREMLDRVKDQSYANTGTEAVLQQSNAIYRVQTSSGAEWGGLSYFDSVVFRNTPLSEGGQQGGGDFYVVTDAQWRETRQPGRALAAMAHGHPGGGSFSLNDYGWAAYYNVPVTAVGSDGSLRLFDKTSLSRDARVGLVSDLFRAIRASGPVDKGGDGLMNREESYLRHLSPGARALLSDPNLRTECPEFFK